MQETVRRVLEMIDRAVGTIGSWFLAGAGELRILEPATWSPGFWALLGALGVLLLLAVLRRRSREPMAVRTPEMLVTRGELVPDAGTGARRGGGGTLTMTVSNLSRYPVQILEVAARTGGDRQFGVTEVSALVPAMGEVDVETRLPVGRLDDGVLDVYAYAAATRVKTYRHRAELIWEPWAKRFKVAPLEQRIVPTKSLASTRHDALRLPEDLEPAHGIWASPPAPTRTSPAVVAPPRPAPPVAGEAASTRSGADRRAFGESEAEDDGFELVTDDDTPRVTRSGPSRRHDDVGAAAERAPDRSAPAAEGGEAPAPAPGPAELFALLGDRPPPRANTARPRRPAAEPAAERDVVVDAPIAPPPTPAEVLALHELLVTDSEVVSIDERATTARDATLPGAHGRREAPGRETSSPRGREASGRVAPGREAPPRGREAPGREAPGREAQPRGREAPGREAPGREAPRSGREGPGSDVVGGETRPERRERVGGPADHEEPRATPRRGGARPERPARSIGADEEDLAPRRQRGDSPLEFPEEF
jgi:hypothetical protein